MTIQQAIDNINKNFPNEEIIIPLRRHPQELAKAMQSDIECAILTKEEFPVKIALISRHSIDINNYKEMMIREATGDDYSILSSDDKFELIDYINSNYDIIPDFETFFNTEINVRINHRYCNLVYLAKMPIDDAIGFKTFNTVSFRLGTRFGNYNEDTGEGECKATLYFNTKDITEHYTIRMNGDDNISYHNDIHSIKSNDFCYGSVILR